MGKIYWKATEKQLQPLKDQWRILDRWKKTFKINENSSIQRKRSLNTTQISHSWSQTFKGFQIAEDIEGFRKMFGSMWNGFKESANLLKRISSPAGGLSINLDTVWNSKTRNRALEHMEIIKISKKQFQRLVWSRLKQMSYIEMGRNALGLRVWLLCARSLVSAEEHIASKNTQLLTNEIVGQRPCGQLVTQHAATYYVNHINWKTSQKHVKKLCLPIHCTTNCSQ